MTAMDKIMITEKYPFKWKNMATQLQKIAAIIVIIPFNFLQPVNIF